MLCEILEMRDSSGSDTATWGDDIQETVEWVTGCFFSPPLLATVTLESSVRSDALRRFSLGALLRRPF